jgi:GNAT superfamily N-acetyltransferase
MTDSDVVIRRFEMKDQPEVWDLYHGGMNGYQHLPVVGQCYSSFVNEKLQPDGDMSNIDTVYMTGSANGRSCFWVAELDGKVVGFVGATETTKYTSDHIELVRMFVSPLYRQKAIGRKLIAALERWAQDAGYKYIYLSTIAALTEPNQLYPKCGFVLREAEDFDISGMIGASSPTIVVGNHYVKTIECEEACVGTNPTM